jgi:hypothetical protein
MTYDIHITATAERDILNASDHIEFSLKNPKVADELLDEADAQKQRVSKVYPKLLKPFIYNKECG